MSGKVPNETIRAFARTICSEAKNYGFRQIDLVRLINAIIDASAEGNFDDSHEAATDVGATAGRPPIYLNSFPLRSERLCIRRADATSDESLLSSWIDDKYGRHFLLSSATAQTLDIATLLRNPKNEVGIIIDPDDRPIGAVAYLDIDETQRRAELRKLIGEPSARGKGFAEEATRLWIEYGGRKLGLQKIYVSTLQTHIRNVQLNESIGFRVEGVLQRELLIGDERHDVLRMGLCFDEFR